ncbi:hypothetical protein [Gordonia sp. MP11Mi]
MLIAIAAMIMVLALAAALAPSASAETPAERCKRETSAYITAWAAIGKKPPVPYKCGGRNQPPPTLSPTTPEEEPEETVAPTSDAPEDSDNGPSMNAPIERREIEHPGNGQAPIGSHTNADGPTPTQPRKTAAGPTRANTPNDPKRNTTPADRTEGTRQRSQRTTPFKHDVDYKPSIGGKTLNGCETGYHRNNGGYGDCFPDYDYNVFRVTYVNQETIPGDPPVSHCETSPHGECRLNFDRAVSTVNTVTTSESIGADVGLNVKAIDAKISSETTTSESTSTGTSTGNGVSISVPAKDLSPTYAADGYAVYAVYSYVLSKYDTRSKEVVWSKIYYYYEPVGLTYKRAARVGGQP